MTHPALMQSGVAVHHSMVGRVECTSAALEREIKTELLAFSSRDKRVQQLHKDIQQGKNKCAETLAAIVTDPTSSRPPTERGRIGKMIWDFCVALTPGRVQRRLRDLFPIETKEEGDINIVQIAIAQGDHSTATLKQLVDEIDDYIPILLEMRSAALAELYRQERT